MDVPKTVLVTVDEQPIAYADDLDHAKQQVAWYFEVHESHVRIETVRDKDGIYWQAITKCGRTAVIYLD